VATICVRDGDVTGERSPERVGTTPPMRVCLMIEGQEGVTWEQWRALAGTCEQHGFDALFRSDHYLSVQDRRERGALDAWTTIAALAATTSTLRLGTLVSPASFRHPSVLAKAVVTADHVSGGRVELGMGTGWWQAEHEAYGFPFADARTRMDVLAEQLEIVHRQWTTEEPFDLSGEHYTLRGCQARPKPVQEPHPPLIVGGSAGARSVALAARWADEYNTIFATPEECAQRRARVAEAWERAGRDPAGVRFSLMTGVAVGADRRELDARAQRIASTHGQDPRESADRSVVGTVEEAVERLRALRDAGVDRVMLQHLLSDDLETVELIGREVIPAVS
jgi:F420-dependent oxidoreductase-like protein